MKLSISNIAWTQGMDREVYGLMKKYHYSGLEIAPTRIFPQDPYEHLEEGKEWKKKIEDQGITISSMQSIWYGRQEMLFGKEEEREVLFQYTKKAIDFAKAIDCPNLVFGCPRNRVFMNETDKQLAIPFFKTIGEYAKSQGTIVGMEANPVIYNTNYMNDTLSVLELVHQVNSEGFRVNLDLGTIIYNEEEVSQLVGQVKYINHVHISEPGLALIVERNLHKELKRILCNEKYRGYISIEMGTQEAVSDIESIMCYVKGVFADDL